MLRVMFLVIGTIFVLWVVFQGLEHAEVAREAAVQKCISEHGVSREQCLRILTSMSVAE